MEYADAWLAERAEGLSAGTVDAYSRAVRDWLAYCRERRISSRRAGSEHVRAYLSSAGFGAATRRQRLVAIRLFYAFVVQRGWRSENPAELSSLGEVYRAEPAPWVPDERQWLGVLEAARAELARSKVMLGLAYEGALRREELVALRTRDVDLGRMELRLIGRPRRLRLSATLTDRLGAYLSARGWRAEALFTSESRRNVTEAITAWTWSKVTRGIARRSTVDRFTTHTPRHLRLTDMARSGHSAAEIAAFAGHSAPSVARQYVDAARLVPAPPVGDLARHREGQIASVLFR